jgi:hypothetical protein
MTSKLRWSSSKSCLLFNNGQRNQYKYKQLMWLYAYMSLFRHKCQLSSRKAGVPTRMRVLHMTWASHDIVSSPLHASMLRSRLCGSSPRREHPSLQTTSPTLYHQIPHCPSNAVTQLDDDVKIPHSAQMFFLKFTVHKCRWHQGARWRGRDCKQVRIREFQFDVVYLFP